MTQSDVIQRLQGVFDDVFVDKVIVSASLSAGEVPEWDSLTQIKLLVAVEQSFSIRFRVGEVEATRNVGEFATVILRHCTAKESDAVHG